MTHPPAAPNYIEQQAGSLQSGDHLLLPDGNRSAEIQRVDVETDDFGIPAMVLATLTGGGGLRIAAASTVLILEAAAEAEETQFEDSGSPLQLVEPATDDDGTRGGTGDPDSSQEPVGGTAAAAVVVPPLPPIPPVVSGPSEEDLALIPALEGTPEAVVEAAARAHPKSVGVLLLSERLAKGINTKSGSCLKDLNDLAQELFIILKDAKNALAVADLLNVLPFDGNRGRWSSVEGSLALSSFICRQLGQEERAAVYEKFLRAPDAMETDPFKARINAKVRQRSLNEPNLYDKEIFRAMDNSNPDAEREWRLLRLEALLFLRAHGGSETIGAPELDRRIGNELESVRS
ncbi:hypothetical protein NicSoilB4_04540 [Arthrobacter sp. NicSoilB4]|uniref:DUF6707 family protein n=1 Tax=Arthrobacter sp. NicSoilB4 TaxID=2830997 RepID=UPI001CC3D18B|nr:DUF6707 family protein [Arthrobacter sp. NicSoilB4]BCW65691.1 hypothetical protein NicSoilB4_04540 [Arthrobacter sp. NicSoilB4]